MKLADKHDAADKLADDIKVLQTGLLNSSKHIKPTLRKRLNKVIKLRNRYTTEIARTESCRALCDKIRATLPREIRDMIYEYIFDVHDVALDLPMEREYSSTLDFEYPDRLASNLPPPRDCECPACTEFFDALDGKTLRPSDRYSGFLYFLRDDECFDAEVQGEMAETYYRITTFTLHHHRTIPKVIEKEEWVFGHELQTSIRKLEIFLGGDYLLPLVPPHTPFSDTVGPSLEKLGELNKNCQITFHITSWPFTDDSWHHIGWETVRLTREELAGAIDVLFGAFKRLRDSGAKIRVFPGAEVVGHGEVEFFEGMELDVEKWINKVEGLRTIFSVRS
jgi:hypothetical protein